MRGFPVGVSAREGIVYVVTRERGQLSGFDHGTGRRRLRPVDLGGAAEAVTIVDGVADGYVTSVDLDTGATGQIDLSGAGGSPQGITVDEQVWTATGSGDSVVAVAPGR